MKEILAIILAVPLLFGNASVLKGNDITVSFSVVREEKIGSIDAEIVYDTEMLELRSVEGSFGNEGVNDIGGTVVVSGFCGEKCAPQNEYVLKLTFATKKTGRTRVEAHFTDVGSFYSEKSLGAEEKTAEIAVFDGKGDFDSDGQITPADRTLLSNMLARKGSYDPRYDIDGDGEVTPMDRTLLSRFLGGWGVEYDAYFL